MSKRTHAEMQGCPPTDKRGHKSLCRINLTQSIKVMVGKKKKVFFVHESILNRPGTFFEAALKREWCDGQESSLELPDDEPRYFDIYAQWLYEDRLYIQAETSPCYYDLGRLYTLGEKLLDRQFQDCLTDAIVSAYHETSGTSAVSTPGPGTINHIYSHTPNDAPVRKLLTHLFLTRRNGEERLQSYREQPSDLSSDFVFDVAVALAKRSKLPRDCHEDLKKFLKSPGCEYHHHRKDEPCGKYGSPKTVDLTVA